MLAEVVALPRRLRFTLPRIRARPRVGGRRWLRVVLRLGIAMLLLIAIVAAGPVYHLLYDGHGSTRALLNGSGVIVGGHERSKRNQVFAR